MVIFRLLKSPEKVELTTTRLRFEFLKLLSSLSFKLNSNVWKVGFIVKFPKRSCLTISLDWDWVVVVMGAVMVVGSRIVVVVSLLLEKSIDSFSEVSMYVARSTAKIKETIIQ